jgi:hypothetical protein
VHWQALVEANLARPIHVETVEDRVLIGDRGPDRWVGATRGELGFRNGRNVAVERREFREEAAQRLERRRLRVLPGYNLSGFWRPDEGRGLPLRLDRDDLAHRRSYGRDWLRYLDFSLLELQLPLDLRPREEEVRDRRAVQGTRVQHRTVAVDRD